MLVVGATAWAGAVAGSLAPVFPAGLGALASALILLLASRWRTRRRASPLLVHASILLAYASLAALTAPPEARVSRAGRLTGRVVDARRLVRSIEVRIALEGAAGETVRVDVPLTGNDSLDRLPSSVVPGALVETLVRGRTSGTGWLVAPCAAAMRPLSTPRGPEWWGALPARIRSRFRARVRETFERVLPPETTGSLVALLTGDRTLLDPRDASALRRAGLAHLFVVSGLHVGWIVGAATILVTRLAGREHSRRAAAVCALALVALSLLPTSAPVLRAAGALLLAQLGSLAGRRTPPGAALGGVTCLLIALDPRLSVSWSFGLTIAATAAIVLAVDRRGRAARATVLLAPAAATWSPIVLMTGRLAPWGAAGTAVALPLTVATLAAGWVAVLLPESAGPLKAAATHAAGWLASVTGDLVRFFGELPWSGRIASPAGWGWCALAEVTLIVALTAPRRRAAGLAALAFVAAASWPLRPLPDGTGIAPTLDVIDVGQGQAVLVREDTVALLVDAGDDRGRAGSRRLVAGLAHRGLRSLDALVISHADRDHAGGAETVLAAAPPRLLALPEGLIDRPELSTLIRSATRRGIPVRPLRSGDVLSLGGIDLVAWHPEAGDRRRSNQASLALYVRTSGFAAWLPGDAGREAEAEWLLRRPPPAVDVLVAGHHGSRDATTGAFLARLAPRAVIVSCGARNRFGHPHPETLRRVRAAGARVWLTAGRGDVRARHDGERLLVTRAGLPPAP